MDSTRATVAASRPVTTRHAVLRRGANNGAQATGDMMKLTLDAAAKQVGTSKSTLLRAIRSGALSAERMGDRAFRVDESELSRWRQGRANDAPSPEAGRATAQHDPAPDAGREAEAWRVRAEAAERMLAQAEATVADLRRRLDAAEERAGRSQDEVLQALAAVMPRLLAAPEKPPEAPAVTSLPPRRGLLDRLRGR